MIDPSGDWPGWFHASPVIPDSERARYTDSAFLRAVAPFDPLAVLPTLVRSNVRLQQTTFNPINPAPARETLHHGLPSAVPYTLYNGEDDYRARAMKDSAILNWLEEKLARP